jgi:hypothetical protein
MLWKISGRKREEEAWVSRSFYIELHVSFFTKFIRAFRQGGLDGQAM